MILSQFSDGSKQEHKLLLLLSPKGISSKEEFYFPENSFLYGWGWLMWVAPASYPVRWPMWVFHWRLSLTLYLGLRWIDLDLIWRTSSFHWDDLLSGTLWDEVGGLTETHYGIACYVRILHILLLLPHAIPATCLTSLLNHFYSCFMFLYPFIFLSCRPSFPASVFLFLHLHVFRLFATAYPCGHNPYCPTSSVVLLPYGLCFLHRVVCKKRLKLYSMVTTQKLERLIAAHRTSG